MKPDKIIDAIGMLPDELIEAADKRREVTRKVKIRPMRTFAAVACVCIAMGAALMIARYYGPSDTSDGLPDGTVTEPTDGVDGTGDTEMGVKLDKIIIDEGYGNSDSAGYFAYDGRVYIHYSELSDTSVVGEKLGKVTNIFEGDTPRKYYDDLHGNMDCEIHKVVGYDPEFMLAAFDDDSCHIYICADDLTLTKGSELYLDRLNLAGGYESVEFRLFDANHENYVKYPLDEAQYQSLDTMIEVFYDAPFVYSDEIENKLTVAALCFTLDGDIPVELTLYEGGYVRFDGGNFGDAAIKLDTDKFAQYIDWLKACAFDPVRFAELLPGEGKLYRFYYKIFASQTYLYFLNSTYDSAEILVYYTNDFGETTYRLELKMPEDIEYDTATPVYAGPGGGSGECEFFLRLTKGNERFYVSFNNFSYTDDPMVFEFGGYVEDTRVTELRSLFPENFHISEFLTTELPATAPNGVYMIEGNGKKLIIGTPSDASMEILLAYFEIERGQNPAYSNEYNITTNVLSPEEYPPDGKYFIHTSAGDVALTGDEAIRVLQKSGANISQAPFYIIDEFGNSVEVKMHRIEGVNEKLVVAEPLIFTVDGFKYQPNQESLRLDVTTMTNGYAFTSIESYLPLCETLTAMGYTVECLNGKILATGEYYSENWRFNAPGETGEAPETLQVYVPTTMPTVSVNGKTAEYQGRVLHEFKLMSSMVQQYSFNDLIIYDGKYYIKPEFLAQMLDMDTDYVSAFYTRSAVETEANYEDN